MLVKSTAPEPGFLVTSLALRDSRQLFKSPRPQCLYSQKENNDCSYSTAFSHNQRRYCGHKGRVAVVILMLRMVLEPLVVRALSHPHTATRGWFQVSLGFGGCILFSIVLTGWIVESQQ